MKKTKNITPIKNLFLLLLGVAVSTGCVKRDLEYHLAGDNVVITLDWGDIPHPQTARFLFYDQTGALFQEHTGLADGYKGTLPAGVYRLVVHNEDARHVDYRGTERYETAEVFAQRSDYAPAKFRESETSCILEPQAVYGAGSCQEFETIKVHRDELTCATIKPERLTRQVDFHFVIRGDASVQSLTGVLNGVSSGVFLASKECNATSCAVEFTAERVQKSTSDNYYAKINVFNLLTTAESTDDVNTMDVVVETDNDNTLRSTIDITETIKEIIADNDDVIPIEIPVEVEMQLTAIGGLTITVRPWQNGTGGGDFE